MSIHNSNRVKWMTQVAADFFPGAKDYEALEVLRQEKPTQLLEGFINGKGHSRIFFYFQKQQRELENGSIQEHGFPEFMITDGTGIKLVGKGLYFMRTTAKGDDNCDKPINTNGTADDQVMFGEISEEIVPCLNLVINQVYKPSVDKLENNEWGLCEEEQRKEFQHVFDKFAIELREALKSLTSNIKLDEIPEEFENEAKIAANAGGRQNNNMISEFEKLFRKWTEQITNHYEKEDVVPTSGVYVDQGPRSELEYWRRKMRKLTCISEQLRSQKCKTVYNTLMQASQHPQVGGESVGRNRDTIHMLTSSWRGLELKVTESLNEAKDNVKYLTTLEKFIEPLYEGTPETIKDTLPALMNSIKMIHTIARYYNTNDKMTGLFIKITTQMIQNCKNYILHFRKGKVQEQTTGKGRRGGAQIDGKELWDDTKYPPNELIPVLKSCIDLNHTYQKQYKLTKERLMSMPKGKQFEFSPNQIFGKFDLFCRRIAKLIDLFQTIKQFKILSQHNLENIDPILKSFDAVQAKLKGQFHDLLSYTENTFDRDFVEFNVGVASVETQLQAYIDKNFETIDSIEDSLKLLRKFQTILQSPSLRNSLDNKYTILFYNYGNEIQSIEDQYQKQKSSPPIVRNLPTVAGSITWSRHLFHRISGPMEQFPQSHIKHRENKKFVKAYNRTGYTLFSFEYLWRQKWAQEVEKAKAGLQATLIIRHPDNNKLYVNFDSEILTLIREAKCLSRIGIDIPESAKIVLLQEDKFKMYNNELQFVLREYDRIVGKIRPTTKSLLVPHLEDLEYKLRPGMVTLTWTSMNIDGYLHHVHQGLAKLEQLIININDIMENRIENNLKALSKTVLVDLPQDAQTFALEEFVSMQEVWINHESEKLKSKNFEVESAVEDLIQTIMSYQLDTHVEPIQEEEIQKLLKFYNWSMYQALLQATKYSLNQMKERICGRKTQDKSKAKLKPFFEVDVHLEGDQCTLKPSLDEVQKAINRAASHVLKSTRYVQNWNQKDLPEDQREPFYDWIAKDKEIVKVILLLTGSIQGTRNSVNKFLNSFSVYDWLWKDKIDDMLKKFNMKNPQLADFEEKLKYLKAQKTDISAIQGIEQIGALSLKTDFVKKGLEIWINTWMEAYTKDLHKRAKTRLENVIDDMKQIKVKIDKEADGIDSLGQVMQALEEIRKRESETEETFRPVAEMYQLLEKYFDSVIGDESDSYSQLESSWKQLVLQSERIRTNLQGQQAQFKKNLIMGIKALVIDVKEYRVDFEQNGPMVPGIAPTEALFKLKQFMEGQAVRDRKKASYAAGEDLFALPRTEYPELDKTGAEIKLLNQLYSLYEKVKKDIAEWKEVQWVEITQKIDDMMTQIETYQKDCARLPGPLRSWGAYKELKEEIENMSELLPLVQALAKPSIRPRHWLEVIEITKQEIPYDQDNFKLQVLIEANLLNFKDDVEDVADNADKQLKLENQLRDEIQQYWLEAELEIKNWKGVDKPCVLGGDIQDISDKLEEHMNALNQMNAMRYVTPFKQEVTDKISQLSDVADVIEKWLKVQTYWTNLVSVFSGGDIAKQMPQEAKKFKLIDKRWMKIMENANETRNVISCCTNEILKSSLGDLQEGLEDCSKKLESYLENKRGIFPRFYFVSNADLLKILSVGSDPNAVQDDFEKLFDAVSRVTFDEDDRRLIIRISKILGNGDTENIQLVDGVQAEGNIEDWLNRLEKDMQKSVKKVCKDGLLSVEKRDLKPFAFETAAQVALLGIQMQWTNQLENSLTKPHKEKMQSLERERKNVQGVMDTLSEMCLGEMPADCKKLQRVKVETLVTIHVHQRDLFITIQDEAKQQRVRDNRDFEWTKNTRVYYLPETEDVQIKITDVNFIYSYEYLGAKERLCITPLTDRCYVTLSQALGMLYGGAPAGPAGTGKTETVKDLGNTLGIYVIVTNCSDEHKYRDMAKIFKGLCQSGLWGCFDEFNRISLPTLSVVAAQVESITTAKKQQVKEFMFINEVRPIRLQAQCGYFITMNPGYAGRQELPENLKVLFRSVSMMVPDRRVIMKVKLASVGYKEFDLLAKKFNVLYKLCEEQLSKQRHYDFGLRNILSVLRTAGNIKRSEPAGTSEEMIMARTLRDMNLSKLVSQDIPLFESLLRDIFPNQLNIPKKVYKDIEGACREVMATDNLIEQPQWFLKIIQLYETSLVRHGFMLVGPAGCGKTNIANTLCKARTKLGEKHQSIRLNPKSITGQQMYGVMNPVTGDWTPGVFSELWSKYNGKAYSKQNTWLTCDGPVDAIWIENLNTVLDDNKILTLANSDRIPMAENVKMVFEVENLNNASPATVSRCGIVYVSESDLSWEPITKSWGKDRAVNKVNANPDEEKFLLEFVEKYFVKPNMMQHLIKNQHYIMYTPPVIRVNQVLNLLTAVLQYFGDMGVNQLSKQEFEKVFIYCTAWGIGGLFETEEREKFHKFLEERKAPLPQISAQRAQVDKETVFDYFVDPHTRDWKLWEAEQWSAPKRIIFSQLLIPTLDSTRAEFIIDKISKLPRIRNMEREEHGHYHTMLVGGPGTAKTSVCLMYASKFDKDEMLFKRINFSSATSPWNFQEQIESELEKKQGKTFHPPRGKKMTIFIDDASMPFINTWGDQVTLEIARQLIELKGMYFLDKDNRGNFRVIENLQFIGAMNHPTNGRNDVPHRFKRHFFSLNMPAPSTRSIENIYGRILELLFNPKKYTDPTIMTTKNMLTDATIALWDQVKRRLLPTPATFHYVFNMRELSRVFQGICTVAQKPEYNVFKDSLNLKEKMPPALFIVSLWRHECVRVFEDKLVKEGDKKVFHDLLDKTTKDKFRDLTPDDDVLLTELQFCDFMREDKFDEYGDLVEAAPFVYEAIPDRDGVRKIIYKKLEAYNEKNPSKKMNLVIFDDALGHLLRITRVINTPSGNMLLVGVGGSGKQSLTKLAAFICKHNFFQIALTKSYNQNNLKDDLRQLYETCGPMGQSACFILTDAEIKQEEFLESMNSMLATGEVAGVIAKEDKDTFALSSKVHWSKEVGVKGYDPTTLELWIYAINRVRDNLHTVLSFSPVGPKFRERARKFPAVFSTVTIDWFLPWPEEALVSVSSSFLQSFDVDCSKDTKDNLFKHMGKVHDMVTEVCELYFQRMRRHVYVTPKSYLSFIDQYTSVYRKKYDELQEEEENIGKGLIKLAEAALGVEELKEDLKKEEVQLNIEMKKANALLKNLEIESAKAQKKSEEVQVVKEQCDEERTKIAEERAEADKDLAQALPYLEKAKQAANSIQPKDITELKGLKQPAEICRLILDAVHILFQKPLVPVGPRVVQFRKIAPLDFIMDSFDFATKATLQSQTFLNQILDFSKYQKDNINEETIEFIEVYLELQLPDGLGDAFTPKMAKEASNALEGMCVWAQAMRDYHEQSKIVNPKLKLLEIKDANLKDAEANAAAAEAELNEVKAFQAKLKAEFDESQAVVQGLQDKASRTKRKMDQAARLISSLDDNKVRWEKNAENFKKEKKALVGDVAKACAFVSYCGPFNAEFRGKLLNEYFHQDLVSRDIPRTDDLQLTDFLVDPATLGSWSLQGLPSDDLSVQNGIMVTRSSRYPLMIDPQGQAISWIKNREPALQEYGNLIINLQVPNLRDALKFPMMEGLPLLIESIENEVDPMLDPLLEKQIGTRGRNKFIVIADQELDYDEKFYVYMTSRLANPHYSPEIFAKTTIIDFTVTQGGLEQQLLGRLIAKEQKSLEEQLSQLEEDRANNTKILQDLEQSLLQRLANSEGSLLEDTELQEVLAHIKMKSSEVTNKLIEAQTKKVEINEKRQAFLPVAARGSCLYFCIVSMTEVNWMYNSSLQQFVQLFDYGIDYSEKAPIVKDRVANIIDTMTWRVYRYINRGLFERDKITFKLMCAMQILILAGSLTSADIDVFLKAGAGVDDPNKPFNWMDKKVWNNIKALSKHRFGNDPTMFFKELPDRISRNDASWREWNEKNEPEREIVPDNYEERIKAEPQIGTFIHMCLVRSFREDRTLLAGTNFIASVLGQKFTAPVTDKIEEIFEESKKNVPVVYLLSAGADPTNSIDEFAKKKKQFPTGKVSMGEEMEGPALELIKAGFVTGKWVVLNNCHLSLEFMAQLEEILNPKNTEVHDDFRLWITCEPHKDFPLGLLQMAIKVTTEPPKGLQAGLYRTFTTTITPDYLEKVEPLDHWRSLLFAVCFMHSVVQERRKFGPLGFCIPYEFNTADLEASLCYIEKHLTDCMAEKVSYQWKAINYMVAEVQYGGRITDNLDREMFITYGSIWLHEQIFTPRYPFNSSFQDFSYEIPEANEHQKFMEYINTMPAQDSPVIFGLHTNADLTYRNKESKAMLNTLVETQPKDTGGSGGKSREDEVKDRIQKELIQLLPPDFIPAEVDEKLEVLKGPKGLPDKGKGIPLNIFLMQEIQRFQRVLSIVRSMMINMVDAIEGTVIMTPELVDAINAVYDFKVPVPWQYDATGVEISWLVPSLSAWIQGLINRYNQLNSWLTKERPPSFWLTGFFNPQGFLTSMKQEVTRMNRDKKWSLDDVDYKNDVKREVITSEDGKVDKQLNPPAQGVLIHGLFMEGAAWSKHDGRLVDSAPKELFFTFPVIHVTAESLTPPQGPGAKKQADHSAQDKSSYQCPVYKYPKRNDKYLIFRVSLKCEGQGQQSNLSRGVTPAMNWKLKGTCLLCQKE